MTEFGATVFAYVSSSLRGEFLHRMENHCDVAIVGFEHEPLNERLKYWLRSDRFPAFWDGVEILLTIKYGVPGIFAFDPILSCDLAIHDSVNAEFDKLGWQ